MSVVEFPRDEPKQIWICDCGCASFVLWSDGGGRCSACDAVLDVDGGGWLERIAGGPDRLGDAEAVYTDINMNGVADLARRRLMTKAQDPAAQLIIVAAEDGTLSAWSSANCAAQYEWVYRKIDDAKAMLKKLFVGCS